MGKMTGGKITFEFFVGGDFDDERTDRQYTCYVFRFIILSSLSLFFGTWVRSTINNEIANPEPNRELLGIVF
jgi:hypothetical protein